MRTYTFEGIDFDTSRNKLIEIVGSTIVDDLYLDSEDAK